MANITDSWTQSVSHQRNHPLWDAGNNDYSFGNASNERTHTGHNKHSAKEIQNKLFILCNDESRKETVLLMVSSKNPSVFLCIIFDFSFSLAIVEISVEKRFMPYILIDIRLHYVIVEYNFVEMMQLLLQPFFRLRWLKPYSNLGISISQRKIYWKEIWWGLTVQMWAKAGDAKSVLTLQ